jgi:hypothetical protein
MFGCPKELSVKKSCECLFSPAYFSSVQETLRPRASPYIASWQTTGRILEQYKKNDFVGGSRV